MYNKSFTYLRFLMILLLIIYKTQYETVLGKYKLQRNDVLSRMFCVCSFSIEVYCCHVHLAETCR